MTCVFTYEGKEYVGEEAFKAHLRSLPEATVRSFMPHAGVASRTPDMPFKDNKWAALALKRMIRYAAEEGFSQIAWTRGQHQVERFSLAKHVDELALLADRNMRGEPMGRRRLVALKNKGEVLNREIENDAQLVEYVGKEMAQRLLAAPAHNGDRIISGLDLDMGGSGMRAFYDKILPNIANDLGKKFGARVGETQVSIGDGADAVAARGEMDADYVYTEADKAERFETVHSLPITPEMRDQALEGQPLFSLSGTRGFSTPEELIAAAEAEFGADWTALAKAGKVEVVQSSREVPTESFADLARGAHAVHLRGVTYFIANNVRPENMRGLILHEVGVHHGFESMLGKRGFREVLRQIDRMVEEDHPAMVEARGYAERYSAHEGQVPEETLAYLIEMHADLPLVNRVLSRIRQWLIKTFGSTFGMRLTVDDLRALAITSLRRVAEQARRESADIVPIAVDPRYSQRPDAGQSGAGSDVIEVRVDDLPFSSRDTALYPEKIDRYARLETEPPPITIYRKPDGTFGIQDGRHRVATARYLGRETIRARIRPPTLRERIRSGEVALPPLRQDSQPNAPDGGSAGTGSATYEELRDAAMNAPRVDMERLAEIERRLAEIDAEGLIPERPNAGDGGDFPLFSRRGESGQNGENPLGAKRDPIESPSYQRRIAELRSRIGGKGKASETVGGAGDEPAGLGGVRGDAEAGRPIGTDAQSLRDILAVSGIRLFTRPGKRNYGKYQLSVDTPIASEADAVLVSAEGAKGNATRLEFDFIDGSNPKEERLPGVHLTYSRAHDDAKGLRLGEWMYRQIIAWADRRGLPVYSDSAGGVSVFAQRTYARLKDMGYVVEKVSRQTKVDEDDGAIVALDALPVYRISMRDPIEAELPGADVPPGDYQIDGITLRERQQRIDEQAARQAEYDKAKPHEIILKDDPDMMFSFGFGRKIKAREAIEMSEAAQREAAAKKRAFEAAARCAIRHGGAMTARDAFLSAQAQAISTGQILGLTASIPAAWAASHMVARNADPERYALNRARIARAAMVAAQARFGEAGYQAGRRAGLDVPTTYDTPEGEPLWDNVDVSRRAGDGELSDDDTPWQEGPRDLTNQGLEEGPWDDPNTFSAQGGARTREGAHVSPAPTGVGEWDTYDITRDLARLLDPAIEPPVEDEE